MSESLIKEIQRLMRDSGCSIAELSRATGIGYATCYRVVSGESDTWTRHAEAMAAYLRRRPARAKPKQQ